MNAQTRALILDALLAAKPFLATTLPCCKERYICTAISTASECGYSDAAGARLARAMIEERIAPLYTIESWLSINVPDAYDARYKNVVQQYRHRWLDALIEEFSK
jgi:hypothetical protein